MIIIVTRLVLIAFARPRTWIRASESACPTTVAPRRVSLTVGPCRVLTGAAARAVCPNPVFTCRAMHGRSLDCKVLYGNVAGVGLRRGRSECLRTIRRAGRRNHWWHWSTQQTIHTMVLSLGFTAAAWSFSRAGGALNRVRGSQPWRWSLITPWLGLTITPRNFVFVMNLRHIPLRPREGGSQKGWVRSVHVLLRLREEAGVGLRSGLLTW